MYINSIFYYIFILIITVPVIYRLFSKGFNDIKQNNFNYIKYICIIILINLIIKQVIKDESNEHLISPILDNHSLIDANYIDQGEIQISEDKLSTSHLGTCSALAFSHNGKNFLAHIDAQSNTEEQIIQKIKKNFNVTELKKKTDINIIPGSWCKDECKTLNIIKNSLKTLDLKYNIYSKKIKWENQNSIYIDKNEISIM